MVTDGGSAFGNAAAMDSLGEGHVAANNLINKSRKPLGKRNSPATSSKVSDLSLLNFGYDINILFGLFGALFEAPRATSVLPWGPCSNGDRLFHL